MAKATEPIQSGLYLINIAISSEGGINNIVSKIPIRYNLRYAQR